MGRYAADIEIGKLPGPYDDALAARYARAALIPDEEFAPLSGAGDQELAERFGVPVEQVALKRGDLADTT